MGLRRSLPRPAGPPRRAPAHPRLARHLRRLVRWIVRAGAPWRMLPHDFPPWEAVYQQTRRWIAAGVFEAMVHDLLREVLRLAQGRAPEPSLGPSSTAPRCAPRPRAVRARGGYDGANRKKGSKVHAAVDTLGHLLALHVTPSDEQERSRVGELVEAVQEATGESVELAYVDQGYSGERPAEEAKAHSMRLEVVKHPEVKRGFVLLPRHWVVERHFAWVSRFRRLVKDYERLPTTLAGLHFVAFACLFLRQAIAVLGASP